MQEYEKEHLQLLRDHLGECTVLLKKDGSFPLPAPCPISAYGGGVRHTVKGGTGSGEVNSRFFVSVEQGLRDAGFTLTTGAWLDAYDGVLEKAKKEFIKAIKARAKEKHSNAIIEGMGAVMDEPEYTIPLSGNSDTAVYVLARNSGEGNDRNPVKGDIKLTDTEIRDILECNRVYRRFLLVLNTGGPVDLSPVMEVGNILILSQLGVDTGTALADLMLGRTVPSGKLATTWAKWEDYPSIGDFGDPDDTHYKEGVYVGYRYFDSANVRPLFPFGFGLGYTEMEVKAGTVTKECSSVTVRATVRNTGNYSGKETVQAYLSFPSVTLDQPYQSLVGFAKSRLLLPGEEEELCITFDLKHFASFSEAETAYMLEAGDYILRIGTDSASTSPAAVLRLPETCITRRVRNLLGDPGFEDWHPESSREEILPDLPVLIFSPEDLPTENISYSHNERIDHALGLLKNDELAYLNIGAFDPKGGLASVIGNAALTVAGAAGESTHMLDTAEYPPIVMADGPAGLRLSREFYRDEEGAHSIGSSLPESITMFLPKLLTLLIARPKKLKKGVQIEEQYATAIPIGTAIAQSWNTEFAHLCGDIVGSEMKRFGVHLWLAPALNIHRSIQCGRNFEYYSEDPLISGSFAAAVTNGVQSHDGCGVTIKHYAANNQETNRYANNSCVSERAMREIYLRGFEICVREAQPFALMTSYNLLNGTHTSEHRGLCVDILRREYGFEGVIMTDWVVSAMTSKNKKYASPNPAKVAAAGCSLFMPGSKNDYANMLKGLQAERVTRKQLQINATYLTDLMKKVGLK